MAAEKLLLIGDSAFAQIAYEYFTHDSDFEVVGFAVEQAFRKQDSMFGLPVVDYESAERHFPPSGHHVFAAIPYTQFNRLRSRLANDAKQRGYRLASYVSSRSFVWRNVSMGEHVFVFEDNTIQPFVSVEDNVVFWSGNHIGHHSKIRKNCFISSHVVISGFCDIGENCFLGVNCTLGNDITIGTDCWIGPGVALTKDCPAGTLYPPARGEPSKVGAKRFFKIRE